jgi:tRNA 2-thiouridine synthesizing protein A
MDANKEIDACGLTCPLPILRAKRALSDMRSGEVLKVLATDPNSVRDFQAFSRQTGNDLLEQQNQHVTTADGACEQFIHWLRRR